MRFVAEQYTVNTLDPSAFLRRLERTNRYDIWQEATGYPVVSRNGTAPTENAAGIGHTGSRSHEGFVGEMTGQEPDRCNPWTRDGPGVSGHWAASSPNWGDG